MLAASYGMPRIVLLRALRTTPHLARAIAAMIADDQRAEAAREAEAKAKKQQQEDEMREHLRQLKEEQDAMRAEQGAS